MGEPTTPDNTSAARWDALVSALEKAVEALDIATDALGAGTEMPRRAILTTKLATAISDLRVAVGEVIEWRMHGKA